MSDFEPAQAFGETSIRLTRPESEESETAIGGHSNWGSSLRRQLPYILVLGLAIVGVAYTNMAHQPLVGYWEFLALATGLVCIVAEWPKLDDKQGRFRLIWTQSVHWVAVLVAMNIMLLSGVQQFIPAPATSLVLLVLLALGTFLAGLNLSLLPICFLGLALALAVPVISWLKQSVLFLVLIAVFLAGVALTLWPRRSRQTAASEVGTK
jgi:NO-binding membrane sensor protein with MHYT domain